VARKRPRIGDVIEIRTEKGFGYFQYTAADPEQGALIRVLPGVFSERVADIPKLGAAKELYFVFFPLGAAVARGLVEIVANAPIPNGSERPRRMKRPIAIAPDGSIRSWAITEDGRDRFTPRLADDERALSPCVIWNDTLLADRIARGWLPQDEANGH
jgi:hypothetical protein